MQERNVCVKPLKYIKEKRIYTLNDLANIHIIFIILKMPTYLVKLETEK